MSSAKVADGNHFRRKGSRLERGTDSGDLPPSLSPSFVVFKVYEGQGPCHGELIFCLCFGYFGWRLSSQRTEHGDLLLQIVRPKGSQDLRVPWSGDPRTPGQGLGREQLRFRDLLAIWELDLST